MNPKSARRAVSASKRHYSSAATDSGWSEGQTLAAEFYQACGGEDIAASIPEKADEPRENRHIRHVEYEPMQHVNEVGKVAHDKAVGQVAHGAC